MTGHEYVTLGVFGGADDEECGTPAAQFCPVLDHFLTFPSMARLTALDARNARWGNMIG